MPARPVGPASRSGVRRSGDDYQDLLAWGAALRVVQPGSGVAQLELEINGVGNVDDVVLRRPDLGDRYGQAKWATTTARTIDEDFMTGSPARGKSILQKFFASYATLRDPARPLTLELLTNRGIDPAHPLLGQVDGRHDRLVPFAADASPRSASGQRLEEWVEHVGGTREQLLEMFEHLVFRPGLTVSSERDRAQVLMQTVGLRSGDDDLRRALDAVGGWVTDGQRVIGPDDVNREIDNLGLRAAEPKAVLLVQAIDRDPHPEDTTYSVDWVKLYEGETPAVRCRPRADTDWARMAAELRAEVQRLEADGWRHVLVRGAMRQATSFLVGAYLPAVRGMTLTYLQGREPWSTDAAARQVPSLERKTVEVGAGSDLAVAVGVAVDPADAVTEYVRTSRLAVERLAVLTPHGGPNDQAVRNAGEAVAYAQTVRDSVRAELARAPRAERIHLFLAGPGGVALLLGHRWNRLRTTVVYEHLGAGRGYTPAFTIDA